MAKDVVRATVRVSVSDRTWRRVEAAAAGLGLKPGRHVALCIEAAVRLGRVDRATSALPAARGTDWLSMIDMMPVQISIDVGALGALVGFAEARGMTVEDMLYQVVELAMEECAPAEAAPAVASEPTATPARPAIRKRPPFDPRLYARSIANAAVLDAELERRARGDTQLRSS